MTKSKVKCKQCGKEIVGLIKVLTRQKRSGQKVITVTEYYCEACFKLKNKEGK